MEINQIWPKIEDAALDFALRGQNRVDTEEAKEALWRYAICRLVTYMEKSMPLTEPVLLVLLSLSEQPRHGYSILKDVEGMSGGRVALSTGTLYGALQRLLSQGWIERFEENEGMRDRRAYRLTSQGRKILQAEVARMKQLTKLASLRMAKKGA